MKPRILGVIGAGTCDEATAQRAHRVGQLLAEAGCVVVNGGRGGVMEAASRGAAEAGGTVLGILLDADPATANPWVTLPIATGIGDARNAIITNTAEAFVAIAGSYGTLSEIAYALKRGKRVVCLGSWNVDPALIVVDTPEEAVARVLG